MANLIQTVMGVFTPNVTSRFADAMGESPAAVTTGLGAAAPALLAGALQRSATPAGARTLLDQVNQATSGGNPLDGLSAVAGDESARSAFLTHGQGLSSALLGGDSNAVTSAVASHAGIGMGSAAKLLGLAAPLVLGAIARAAGPAPTATGLQSLLGSQRAGILSALPAGLGSLFGLGQSTAGAASRGAASAESHAAHAVSSGASTTANAARAAEPGIGRFLPWVIAALVLVGLLFAMRNCAAARRPAVTPPTVTTPTVPTTPAPAVTAPSVPMVSMTLPGGTTVNVPQGSIGFSLATFLNSPAPAPKTFVFDNLNYDTASHALTPASQPTVAAISTILKAYPNANVRVVGYTDNQGDPAANKTLSNQRATTVQQQLVSGGVAADHVEAAGMGEANPIADNSTEAGRATNRRTELVVIKK
jgi:outer membrane protein OmpA-like peptidoglycan-associated protein